MLDRLFWAAHHPAAACHVIGSYLGSPITYRVLVEDFFAIFVLMTMGAVLAINGGHKLYYLITGVNPKPDEDDEGEEAQTEVSSKQKARSKEHAEAGQAVDARIAHRESLKKRKVRKDDSGSPQLPLQFVPFEEFQFESSSAHRESVSQQEPPPEFELDGHEVAFIDQAA